MRILLLGSQHGNERLGDALYAHLTQYRPELLPHITFMIGNPKAYAKNVRYIESDLNRSYRGQGSTYEENRALDILRTIKEEGFDLVLDLHTTQCIQPICIIVGQSSTEITHFKKATEIQRIVYMKHELVQTSLIGVCDISVSIEANVSQIDTRMLNELCDDIERYISRASSGVNHLEYEIFDLLRKNDMPEIDSVKLQNFEKTSQNFYPILTGKNSYRSQTNYLGFKARIIEMKTTEGTL